ncbi:MAG: 30S ribosome-binding factor RbfA [Deltaproteobacteria bacterium]|nr:30S ribosome-binding factor RbfA [Deltaproteobacteria bacterium]
MKPYARAERVSGLIQKALSDILKKEIKDPRLEMIVITGVKVSRDLRIARIYFTSSSREKSTDEVTEGFESARGYVKRTLARKLGLRYMPDLKFFYDASFDYGSQIDEILKTIETDNGPTNRTG